MTNKELKKALQEKANKMEDLPIRTVDEHNEYIKQLQKEEQGIVKLSILIASTSGKRLTLNNLCQEFYRQIELNKFSGKGLERWYVKTERLNEDGSIMMKEDLPVMDVATARYRHASLIELLYEESDSSEADIWERLGEKAKSNNHVLYSVDNWPDKDFIKNLMEHE